MGIGVPLILAILAILYFYCIRSTRTNFIDSEGKVVTAYSANKFTKWWYSLLGKDVNQKYETNSPLGGSPDIGVNDEGIDPSAANNDVSRRGTERGSHSNDLMLEEEKYYDEDGNELSGRNY